MTRPSKNQWVAFWQSLGGQGDGGEWHERLMLAYGEPHRHYHTGQHIAECLAELDEARHLAGEPATVECALWFHDAVYDPKANDNEERSAALAVRFLADAGLPDTLINTVRKLVMATKRHEIEPGSDQAVMVDVDLSILGREARRFTEYEEQIRLEYGWVPEPVFASKRAEILERFLARPRIFQTAFFSEKYERSARRNLEDSVKKLKRMS